MEQKSSEWFQIKKGKIGASHAQSIAVAGKGLETVILETMSEYYSSGNYESYTNEHIERGVELEETARSIFELEYGLEVKQVGFIQYNDFIGASPDGLIGDDGLIEIKCLGDKGHFNLLLEGEKGIDSKYWSQMQMQMLVCERKYNYFISYNPNFKQSLIVHKILPDLEYHNKLLDGFKIAEKRIKEIKNKLGNVN